MILGEYMQQKIIVFEVKLSVVTTVLYLFIVSKYSKHIDV